MDLSQYCTPTNDKEVLYIKLQNTTGNLKKKKIVKCLWVTVVVERMFTCKRIHKAVRISPDNNSGNCKLILCALTKNINHSVIVFRGTGVGSYLLLSASADE